MTRFRSLFIAFSTVLVVASVGVAVPNYSSVNCLCASAGCGQGSNECKNDCFSMTCTPHSSPFKMCKCEAGSCQTVDCEGDA